MNASDHPSKPRQARQVDSPSRALRRGGGLRDEIEQVDGVVSAVNDRVTRNKLVARSLAALKQMLYDADDTVDELDCYSFQQELHARGGPWHWHHPNKIDGRSNQLPSTSRKLNALQYSK
ncbi:hypothetical protein VPH35_036716 [Triticum aestivum]